MPLHCNLTVTGVFTSSLPEGDRWPHVTVTYGRQDDTEVYELGVA